MNKYKCSDGTKVSEATIRRRLSEVYRRIYESPHQLCWGCNAPAQGTAHIIPKKRCKDLGKTELIWSPVIMFPACHTCNSICESYKGEDIKGLLCYGLILEVTEQFDPERYKLMTL